MGFNSAFKGLNYDVAYPHCVHINLPKANVFVKLVGGDSYIEIED